MVVASKGGWPAPPAWYLNLSEQPEVEVQVKGDLFQSARARTATAEERARSLAADDAEWPDYDAYQEKHASARFPARSRAALVPGAPRFLHGVRSLPIIPRRP